MVIVLYVGLNIIVAGLLSTYRGSEGEEESGMTVFGGVLLLGLPGHFPNGIVFLCPEFRFARLDGRFVEFVVV